MSAKYIMAHGKLKLHRHECRNNIEAVKWIE